MSQKVPDKYLQDAFEYTLSLYIYIFCMGDLFFVLISSLNAN